MFCKYCGVENSNGSRFCKSCGKSLGDHQPQEAEANSPIAPNENSNINANENVNANINANVYANAGSNVNNYGDGFATVPPINVKKKNNMLPLFIIGGAFIGVIVIAVLLFIIFGMKQTINLNDYLTIKASGYNGYGTVEINIDWDSIEEEYGEKISFTGSAKDEYGSFIDYMSPIEIIEDGVSVETNTYSYLTNNDEIEYKWNVDDVIFEYVKCNLEYNDGKYKVSELTPIKTFDAFADLSVVFEGVAPNGCVNISYKGKELSSADFSCENTSGLSNGDKIKIFIDDSNIEYCASSFGAVPAQYEKEYTVEGLDSYLMSSSDLDEVSVVLMKQRAEDVFAAEITENFGEGEELVSLTYLGNYFLTTKSYDYNVLYLVYKGQVNNSFYYDDEEYNEINDIYWFISYSDLRVDSKGAVMVDILNSFSPYNTFTVDSNIYDGFWGTKTWSYYGYPTLDELYSSIIVTFDLERYYFEENVDESLASSSIPVEKEETDMPEGDFILPNSDTELITKADLKGFTIDDCRIARNEIYARHGRKFNDEELQAYFDAKDWYVGTIEPDDFQESELSDIEIANRNTIIEFEEKKGYR